MTMSHYSAAKESGSTALLLINKQARNGDSSARYVKELLQQSQISIVEPDEKETGSYSDIIRAYADRVDFVIIGGGDGTLNSAAPGLVDTGLPLGVLPLGTANDFARTVGIPREIRQAVQVIASGQRRAVDLGEVNGHLFFNVSSIGFSAALARGLSAKSKKRWGTLGYALAAFKLLKQSRPFRVEIEHDGIKERVRTVQVSVGNGRFYGGGMAVADSAAPDDGRLDVYSLEVSHWWEMVALIPFIRKGTHGRWRKVRAFSARQLTLHTSKPHDINADGELVGKTPAVFGIREKAIQVFAPPR
ncbi:lipid kinase [Pectobacterium brasiliense]|uniref:Lipid kinase n=1 Tax=Pectobacterium brasiliense TaxID=180957 RepID=A0AAE3BCR3_9GAMM|nr:lipid kinase [Pectobacterium brasiliense]MBA0217920.1 lipid kinase [Pectobacterium brasiliense]MBN3050017.1 lipid kinase [Pectobacterium brasiliense]MBN3071588.1 lipid kinase [Pectobacterium brasiliense]MBN3170953.1 lipid kinase [Pectobacterium brasiliense]